MVRSHVFHRRLDRDLPMAARAEGVWIYDESGRKYLDASGGPICVNVGHGRHEIIQAIHGQIHLALGRPERYRLIARWQSYHGSTLGALSASGKPSMRDPFLPFLPCVVHIPPPYCLRCYYGLTHPTCGLRCARALEEAVLHEGRNNISAFLAETICGATMCAVVPPPEYYAVVSEICKKYGILLILDLIEREDLVRQAERRGACLQKILQPLRDHAHVADIRGLGLMWAVELVKDRDGLRPFPRSRKVAERLHDALMEKGIITCKCTGFSGGNGDGLMLGFPFIIDERELDTVVDAFKEVPKDE